MMRGGSHNEGREIRKKKKLNIGGKFSGKNMRNSRNKRNGEKRNQIGEDLMKQKQGKENIKKGFIYKVKINLKEKNERRKE